MRESGDDLATSRDAFAYMLGYYTGDYAPVGQDASLGDFVQVSQQLNGQVSTAFSGLDQAVQDREVQLPGSLYNGNIPWMTTEIAAEGFVAGQQQQTRHFQYDQLHRIRRSQQWRYNGTTWESDATVPIDTTSAADLFATEQGPFGATYTYDENGNLLTLTRNTFVPEDSSTAPRLDQLTMVSTPIGCSQSSMPKPMPEWICPRSILFWISLKPYEA